MTQARSAPPPLARPATPPQQHLVITEAMYNPGGTGLAEFIELTNISPSVTLDLTGVHFNGGVEFNFTGSAVPSLPPGAKVLVVRDTQPSPRLRQQPFRRRYLRQCQIEQRRRAHQARRRLQQHHQGIRIR